MNQTELSVLVCSGDKLDNVAKLVPKSPSIKFVISMDPIASSVKESFPENVKLLFMGDVEKDGSENPQEVVPPSSDHIATICYTSGTTGNPKGALVSHQNYIADTAGAIEHGMTICEDDVHISYLPLAHSMERTVQAALWYFGAAVGFYRGDVLKLLEDISELKPTIFVSVPRLFNRIHDRVISQVEKTGGSKRDLFWKAYHVKEENLKRNKYTHKLYDGLVFKKVRARLGGRVRYMLTGSAPISSEVLNFLRICFSCPVIEGYGQTECCAAATLTSKNEVSMGNVGTPICSNEIKLVDVPDMDYLVTDKPYPRGEICVRGPNVFKGYFKEPEKTAEALDKDGWLHTGDIGHIDEYGNVKIIDRKKNIFKLSQGEYVAPEKIENIIVRVPLIAQSFVYGDRFIFFLFFFKKFSQIFFSISLQSQLVAVVVPDEEEATNWAKSNNITFSNFAELCQNEKLRETILKNIVEISKTSQLKGFEIIRAIHLHHELFSVENDILTPTFKLKRPQARKAFQAQLDQMYQTLNEQEKKQEKE